MRSLVFVLVAVPTLFGAAAVAEREQPPELAVVCNEIMTYGSRQMAAEVHGDAVRVTFQSPELEAFAVAAGAEPDLTLYALGLTFPKDACLFSDGLVFSCEADGPLQATISGADWDRAIAKVPLKDVRVWGDEVVTLREARDRWPDGNRREFVAALAATHRGKPVEAGFGYTLRHAESNNGPDCRRR